MARDGGADALRVAHQILVDDLVQAISEDAPPVAIRALVGCVVARELVKS